MDKRRSPSASPFILIRISVCKKFRRQIAVAGIRKQSYDVLSFKLWAPCKLDRCEERSTGRDADEDAFRLTELAAILEGILVRHLDDFVVNLRIERLRHKARPDALNLMRACMPL